MSDAVREVDKLLRLVECRNCALYDNEIEKCSEVTSGWYGIVPLSPVCNRQCDKFKRYKVVTLCGSTRFYRTWRLAEYEETMAGRVVLAVAFYPHGTEHGETVGCTPEQKMLLDSMHQERITMSNEILVLDVGGYIGESTRNEIMFAEQCGKPVRYWSRERPGYSEETPTLETGGCDGPVCKDDCPDREYCDREAGVTEPDGTSDAEVAAAHGVGIVNRVLPVAGSLHVTCNRCGHAITEFGALVFSPPLPDGRPEKWHICVDCWPAVRAVATDERGGSFG